MIASHPKVAVVMSTYNGEQYVAQQLDSILAQDIGAPSIFVRDDGSPHEACRDVLKRYEAQGKITLFCEQNVGVTRSFLRVLDLVPNEYDFVALSDQDDVWHADKLRRAIKLLSITNNALPQAYCAEYRYCDAAMQPGERSHLNKRGVDFGTMLYENVTSGNTMVINRELKKRIVAAGSTDVYTHDWWISLVACALGHLTFDDFLCLDYRRTGENASASGNGGRAVLLNRLHRYVAGDELALVTRQLERLRELYGTELDAQKRALLDRCLDGTRWQKATNPAVLRQTMGGEVALRLLFLTGAL